MSIIPKDQNPFPGIRSYEFHESHLFFGREKQVLELTTRLEENRFIVITGSSGCGKSSLIKAGLLPALVESPGGGQETSWDYISFRPGDDPFSNLSDAIVKWASDNNADSSSGNTNLTEQLSTDPDFLESILLQHTAKKEKKLLLFIDQFEELFRFKKTGSPETSEKQAGFFVASMIRATADPARPFYVVLSMRSDFIDECTEFEGFTSVINKGVYLVPRMTQDEKRDAIEKPIEACSGSIDPGLTDRLLVEVGNDPDGLPVLQHALMRTWDYWIQHRTEGEKINQIHYNAIGTMKEALSLHAEEIFQGLSGDDKKTTTEKIFKSLTDIGESQTGIRRPTSVSELSALANTSSEKIIEIVDIFRMPGRTFLMPPYQQTLTEESIIDISHESLMRIWKRFKGWVEEEIQAAQLYLKLANSAALYQEGKAGLWVNPELQLALNWHTHQKPNQTWANRYDPSFDRSINFLEHSRKQHETSLLQKERQQKKTLQMARRSAYVLGIASVISLVFLVISLNMRFKAESSEKEALEKEKVAMEETKKAAEQRKHAIIQKRIAEQQHQIAEQQKIITEEQKEFAIEQQNIAQNQQRIAVIQKEMADSARKEAVVAKEDAIVQREEAIKQKDIADKERTKAEISEKEAQRLRKLAVARAVAVQAEQINKTENQDLAEILALYASKINTLNNGHPFDKDICKAMISVRKDKSVLRQHKDAVRSVRFSPDGKHMASCGDDGQLILWNKSHESLAMKIPEGSRQSLRSIVFSPASDILVAGSFEGNLYLWKAPFTDNKAPESVIRHQSGIHDITFSDNNTIYFSDADKKLFRINTDAALLAPEEVIKLESQAFCLCYLAHSGTIALGTENGSLQIVNPSQPAIMTKTIPLSEAPLKSIGALEEKNLIAAGDSKGAIFLYNTDDFSITNFIGHISGINGLVFNKKVSQMISCSYDGTVRIWDYSDPEFQPVIIEENDSWVMDLDITPDGKTIATAGQDKTVRVIPIDLEIISQGICKDLKSDLSNEEWNKYIGTDISKPVICNQNSGKDE